jgi:hypothetical protein
MIAKTASINELYNKLTTEITEHNITKEDASNVLYKGFLQTENPNYLYKAAKLSDEFSFPALFTNSLVKLKRDQSDTLKEYLKNNNKLDYQTAFEFFRNFKITEEVVDLFGELMDEELAKPFIEAKQEAYIAQQEALKTNNSIDSTPETGWFKGNQIEVKYSDAKLISNFEHKGVFGKLYAVLSKKFDLPKWESALDKGVREREEGQNGIKIIDSKLLELKINGGERLYTKTIHTNENGDYLAVFDKETNHKGIKSIAKGNLSVLDDCSSIDLSGVDAVDEFDG